MSDEVIRELWAIKDALVREYGATPEEYIAALRRRTRPDDEPIVNLRALRTRTPPPPSDGEAS